MCSPGALCSSVRCKDPCFDLPAYRRLRYGDQTSPCPAFLLLLVLDYFLLPWPLFRVSVAQRWSFHLLLLWLCIDPPQLLFLVELGLESAMPGQWWRLAPLPMSSAMECRTSWCPDLVCASHSPWYRRVFTMPTSINSSHQPHFSILALLSHN
ncbi:hypothetical protein HAX54_013364 [Datura stramonium]|uniref:Uncharacterized protein n=1 Tax=Datura stramonium TaxID=4076 RepID=A0ABS8TLA3_DATST|nr:hypothetical protein [Datura stramonium]